MDSQSVRTTQAGGVRGYDGGKGVQGRKRRVASAVVVGFCAALRWRCAAGWPSRRKRVVEFGDFPDPRTESPMTKTTMPLSELLEKHDEGDFLRAVAEAVLQLIMETDVEGVVGASRHERTADRTTHRNGYRDRPLDTRLGTLNLRVPKLRQGSYFPGFLEPRRTSEKALVALAIVLGPMADEARSRKPGSAASRRAGWTSWSRPWGCRGSRRAPCRSSAFAMALGPMATHGSPSTTAWASSFTARSPGAGRMSGSTRRI